MPSSLPSPLPRPAPPRPPLGRARARQPARARRPARSRRGPRRCSGATGSPAACRAPRRPRPHREDRERQRGRGPARRARAADWPEGGRADARRDRRLERAAAGLLGRAVPEVPQVTMHLAGISPSPGVMTDERGNVLVFRAISGAWMERLERCAAVEFGGAGAATEYPMTVRQARGATVRGSYTLAIRIGDALAAAAGDPVAAVVAETGAFPLVGGKVTDVERRTTKGFVRGSVVIEGLGDDAGRLIRLEIQNENLVALEQGAVLASVPDLISVLDTETADAIPTERVRYGQRVTVIAMACDPVWRTAAGLGMAGPRAFGYDFDYVPVEELAGARA